VNAPVDCCIVGGGPAGMMLGLLMARAGLAVTVLESQPDFDRDFRGDTVHASTLEVLDQIALADQALEIPHSRLKHMLIHTPTETIELVDFGNLPSRFPYIAIMPQAEFLEFLCREAERYPNFRCLRNAPVQALVEAVDQSGQRRIDGVRYGRGDDLTTLHASLTVAADGRFSRLRKLAGVQAVESTAPMDVCWFRLSRRPDDGHETGGFFTGQGRLLVCIPRGEQWQIGYVFPKGDFAQVRGAGLAAFRDSLRATAPWLGERTDEISGFSDLHLLKVKADRLRRWHQPGLLFIGDAAHIMTPVGGVGINVAIADAVETANVLANPEAPALASGPPPDELLARIQRRREWPTRIVQAVQARIQQVLVERALADRPFELPGIARLALTTPGLRQLPLRVFAFGASRTRLRL
jgi:2-polyprenyl-6-methoxyphenol hydroxylase-like FAD-dependent oxidoreductase